MNNLAQELNKVNESFKEKQLDETYNSNLIEKIKELKTDSFDLFGNYVLIVPFKLEVKKSKSGLILQTHLTEEFDEDTFRRKVKDIPFPYQYKGIVVKISDECSDKFKQRIKVGDTVGFMKQNFGPIVFEMDPNNLVIGEETMVVKVNENHIDRKFK